MSTTQYTASIQKLYVAYFGRPADPLGLAFWEARVAAQNGSTAEISRDFAKVPEFATTYAGKSPVEIVNAIYVNLFGRNADTAGLLFWAGHYQAGNLTLATIIDTIAGAAVGSDVTILANKTTAATSFTEALDTASEILAYNTATASAAKAFITGVTDDASLAAAIAPAALDATTANLVTIANPPPPPSIVSLTNAIESKVGTAGADTFNAAVDNANSTNTTLNSGDVISGGAGEDALNLTISNTGTPNIVGVTMSGVERVQVQNVGTGAAELNLVTTTGVTTLSSYGSASAVKFSNVAAIAAAEMANGSSTLELAYAAAAVAGTADAQTLTLNNQPTATFTVNGIETLNVNNSNTATTLTLGANNNHTKVAVSGGADVTLVAADGNNKLVTVDASALTGKFAVSGLGTAVTKVVGGSAADTITVAAANISATVTLDGGAGNDTLVLDTAVTAANAAAVKNFETVSFSDNGGVSQDAAAFASATIKFLGTGANAVTNLGATQGVAAGVSSTSVATTLKADTLADTTAFTIGGDAAVTVGTVTINGAETVNLVSGGTAANTITTLTDSVATKLNINATKALTITNLTGSSVLSSIDASASTAGVTVSAALSAAGTILGGAGNDVFTGSTGNDTISGGLGNDNLTGNGGRDTIDGGAGDDTIVGGSGNDVLTGGDGNDVITSGGGNDNINGGNGDDTIKLANAAALTTNGGVTIAGGAGTDTLEFTGDADMNFNSDPTILNNITGIEAFSFSAITAGKIITVGDGTVSALGGTLNLTTSSNASNVFDASAVLASNSKVVFSAAATVTNGQTYVVGNGIDQVTMTTGDDTVKVTNNAFLSATDTITGGLGSDTLQFTSTTSATITAAQLSKVTGMETFNVTTGSTGNYTFTLTDAIVAPNASLLGAFGVTRAAEAGTLKVDASAVTSGYTLTLTGGNGADTLIGGAGADTITGGAGNDVLTGGGGADTFSWATGGGTDTITDFNFGTSSTTVDVFKVTSGATFAANAVAKASGGALADARIVVLDSTTYADIAAMNTAVTTGGAQVLNNTNAAVILWQDTLGNVHVTLDTNGLTTAGQTDLAILSGTTIVAVSAVIGTGDFSLA
jgi:Ca2+-binding RTX toxin-like protein